jgi:hypothetical protein
MNNTPETVLFRTLLVCCKYGFPVFTCGTLLFLLFTHVKLSVSDIPGYGMAGVRVDGNDIFAVHATVCFKMRCFAVNALVLL